MGTSSLNEGISIAVFDEQRAKTRSNSNDRPAQLPVMRSGGQLAHLSTSLKKSDPFRGKVRVSLAMWNRAPPNQYQ